MIYPRVHRLTLRERVAEMRLPDISAVMERIGADYQQPSRIFPAADKMIEDLGLDLGCEVSSPELSKMYAAVFVELNHLKS